MPPVTESAIPVTSTSSANVSAITHLTAPTSSQDTIPLTSNPPTLTSSAESPAINCSREVTDVVGKMFPDVDLRKVHHPDVCVEKGLCHLTNAGKFKHEWLSLKAKNDGKSKCNSAFDSVAGLWWLVYIEGRGMFCLLCMKHIT